MEGRKGGKGTNNTKRQIEEIIYNKYDIGNFINAESVITIRL